MDGKRMLQGKGFYLAAALAAAALVLGTSFPTREAGKALEAGTFYRLLKEACGSQVVLFALPAAAVLPYGDAYLREEQLGFIRFLLTRRTKRTYLLDKLVTVPLGGFLAWLAAELAVLLLYFAIFFGQEATGGPNWDTISLLASAGLRLGLTAGILANVSAALAALTKSAYMAYGLPFVIYYFLVILRERYLQGLYCISPQEWILAEEYWGPGQAGLPLFLFTLLLATAALHGLSLARSIQEV